MRKTESQKIALCGMLGALSVVLLLLGSALQIGTYAAPMLAAFLLIPVLEEYGTRYALTLYVCVAILAVLFVPETELALPQTGTGEQCSPLQNTHTHHTIKKYKGVPS